MNQETRVQFGKYLEQINNTFIALDAELERRAGTIRTLTAERDDLDVRLKRFVNVVRHRNPMLPPSMYEMVIRVDRAAAFQHSTPFEVMFAEAMKAAVRELELDLRRGV